MSNLPPHRLVTTKVAAEWIRVSVHTIRRLAKAGTLTNHGDEKHYRFDMIQVDEYRETRNG